MERASIRRTAESPAASLLILPRQPHGPREPKLLRTCHERFVAWVEKYAGGH